MSHNHTLDELRAQGVALGLSDHKLAEFVLNQQSFERDERARYREAEKAKTELEKAKAEVEKAKVQADAEKAKAQAEIDKLKVQSDHAENMRRLELGQSDEFGNTDSNAGVADPLRTISPSMSPILSPKFPPFTDGEDIGAYLIRFERIAELLSLPADKYSPILSSLLTGKALEIYIGLSAEITEDYQSLKAALLKGFRKTPGSFRLEFKNARPKFHETFKQFATTLERLFDYWISAAEVPNTFEGLRDFIILDQFMAAIPDDLRIKIKELTFTNLNDVVNMADRWADAHRYFSKDSRHKPKANNFQSRDFKSPSRAHHKQSAVGKDLTSQPQRKRTCYSCGSDGHLKKNCPQNPASFFHKHTSSRGRDPTSKAECSFAVDNVPISVPYSKFCAPGYVNGKFVKSILRDTGCSSIIISDNCVQPPVNCTTITVLDYLGRPDHFPVCKSVISSPLFTGECDAIIAPIRHCDVLIGNVPGAKDSLCTPDVSSPPKLSGKESVCAVTTRARAKRLTHPLIVPSFSPIDVKPDDFKSLQLSCETLEDIRQKAKCNEVTVLRNESSFTFIFQHGLLYRKCVSSPNPLNVGKLALVVPYNCRNRVLKHALENIFAGHFLHRKTENMVREHFFGPAWALTFGLFVLVVTDAKDFLVRVVSSTPL